MPSPQRPFLVNRLIETDHSGRIVYATPEVGAVFGITPRELIGRDLPGLFKDGRRLRTLLRAALSTGREVETITAAKLSGLEIVLTATRLDARRLQWRLVRADERERI